MCRIGIYTLPAKEETFLVEMSNGQTGSPLSVKWTNKK